MRSRSPGGRAPKGHPGPFRSPQGQRSVLRFTKSGIHRMPHLHEEWTRLDLVQNPPKVIGPTALQEAHDRPSTNEEVHPNMPPKCPTVK